MVYLDPSSAAEQAQFYSEASAEIDELTEEPYHLHHEILRHHDIHQSQQHNYRTSEQTPALRYCGKVWLVKGLPGMVEAVTDNTDGMRHMEMTPFTEIIKWSATVTLDTECPNTNQ